MSIWKVYFAGKVYFGTIRGKTKKIAKNRASSLYGGYPSSYAVFKIDVKKANQECKLPSSKTVRY